MPALPAPPPCRVILVQAEDLTSCPGWLAVSVGDSGLNLTLPDSGTKHPLPASLQPTAVGAIRVTVMPSSNKRESTLIDSIQVRAAHQFSSWT